MGSVPHYHVEFDLCVPLSPESPVVGQDYMVPCINGVAVAGEAHTDLDHFNCTPQSHYHTDSRFEDTEDIGFHAMIDRGIKPDMRIKTCIRSTPVDWPRDRFGMTQIALHLDYHDKHAVCGRCPHKGMPIHNGVCSGHRLKWGADGTIHHKPPYTLSIVGTNNKVVLDHYEDPVSIDITEDVSWGEIFVEMHDRDGQLIGRHQFSSVALREGDTFGIKGCAKP